MSFTQEHSNQKLDELQISYGNDDDDDEEGVDDPTSNIQLLTDNSQNVVLERKVSSTQSYLKEFFILLLIHFPQNLVVNDQGDLFDMNNAAGLEIITSDGRKLRFLQTIQ